MKRKYVTLAEVIIIAGLIGFFITQFSMNEKNNQYYDSFWFSKTCAAQYCESASALIAAEPKKYLKNGEETRIFSELLPLTALTNGKGSVYIEQNNTLYSVTFTIQYTVQGNPCTERMVSYYEL